MPKYAGISEILLFLRHYDNMDSNDNKQFKVLVKKAMLYYIEARTEQALLTLSIDNIIFNQHKVIFLTNKTMKHTEPNT